MDNLFYETYFLYLLPLAQDLIERNIYSTLQVAAYAFPDKDGNSVKLMGFKHLVRFLHRLNKDSDERRFAYGIRYLSRSIQRFPVKQQELNQFIQFFIQNSQEQAAKKAMISFKASISINNHFKSCFADRN